MANKEKTSIEVEGTKPFADTLRMFEGGELSSDLAEKLRDLNANLSEHAATNSKATGRLTLTISLTHEKGLVTVITDITTKEPKTRRAPTALWLTPGNNLSRQDPRQMEMGPRALAGDSAPKDVGAPTIVREAR